MIRKSFLLRLVLDAAVAGLLLAALAYYWLSNTAHEVIGTVIFVLVIAHNVFNRRWYGAIAKPRREARSRMDLVLTLAFLIAMALLLVTSLMISRSVFSFLPFKGGFSARQVHTFSAYWTVALMAIHLGIRWERVMNAVRSAMNATAKGKASTLALRLLAAAIAAYGVYSSVQMGVGAKLTLQMSLDGWDFESSAPGFFLNWMSIVGLYVFLAHYFLAWIRITKNQPLEGTL
jgi:hypothetical protein